MASVATVLAVFALVLVAGLVLRRWSQRRVSALAASAENEPDPRDLADPSRWPAPPAAAAGDPASDDEPEATTP